MTEIFDLKTHRLGMAYKLDMGDGEFMEFPVYPSSFISEIDGKVPYAAEHFAGRANPDRLIRWPRHDYIRKDNQEMMK